MLNALQMLEEERKRRGVSTLQFVKLLQKEVEGVSQQQYSNVQRRVRAIPKGWRDGVALFLRTPAHLLDWDAPLPNCKCYAAFSAVELEEFVQVVRSVGCALTLDSIMKVIDEKKLHSRHEATR